jgi:hypothetical protein
MRRREMRTGQRARSGNWRAGCLETSMSGSPGARMEKGRESGTSPAAYPTCYIRPLNQVFESTFPCLSQFADSPEEEYNRDAFICSTSKGVTYTVHGILTFISRSIGLCLQSLHHRFRDWTKPSVTSLLLGSLADLARSKSELMAEKRPPPSATHRPQSARETTHLYQNGSAAPGTPCKSRSDLEARAVDCSARYAPAVASPGISPILEIQVQSGVSSTEDFESSCGLDQGNGQG